jgi:hypothetical protein
MPKSLRPFTSAAPLVLSLVWLAHAASGEPARAWRDRRVAAPFVFHSDFPLDRHQSLLGQMTQLQDDVILALGRAPAREPIDVYLFASHQTYRLYIKRYFPGAPERRAMFIKSQSPGNVFAYYNSQLPVDLRHECTHALLHASLPFVPLWLDEGLAEYFEVPPEDRPFNHPHFESIRRHVRWRKPASIAKLERLHDLQQMGQHEYRDAWAWIHFMLHGPSEARGELIRFLDDLERHVPPGRLSERLARRLPDVNKQFIHHFRTWTKPARSSIPAPGRSAAVARSQQGVAGAEQGVAGAEQGVAGAERKR